MSGKDYLHHILRGEQVGVPGLVLASVTAEIVIIPYAQRPEGNAGVDKLVKLNSSAGRAVVRHLNDIALKLITVAFYKHIRHCIAGISKEHYLLSLSRHREYGACRVTGVAVLRRNQLDGGIIFYLSAAEAEFLPRMRFYDLCALEICDAAVYGCRIAFVYLRVLLLAPEIEDESLDGKNTAFG